MISIMTKPPFNTLEELQTKFPSASNYLVGIFLIHREYGKAQNSTLARQLGVSKPAVNQAIGRLKAHGLALQDSYGAISLSEQGNEFAATILKRHYLSEYLLVKRLNYPWDKADEEAQRMQDALSQEFTDYLYEFFGRPQTCPHGNPFPGSPCEERLIKAKRANKAPQGEELTLIRITEEGEAVSGLLKFCHMHHLYPGTRFKIIRRINEATQEMETGGALITLPDDIAEYLCFE